MAHLKQKVISDASCKTIIIDTILEAVRPLTQRELLDEIASIFHVLVLHERFDLLIKELQNEEAIFFDAEGHIKISQTKEVEYNIAKLNETSLRKKATILWVNFLRMSKEIAEELESTLSQALPIFLRSVFVKHGVASYELLTAGNDGTTFDLKKIAHAVATQFEDNIQADIEELLPSIFQVLDEPEVLEYLKHSIHKAVGYICEVISDENLNQITGVLNDLTIYLDTSTIYRLLNLQGQARYEAIKGTIDYCNQHGIKLKVSAATKKELSSRLKYDAKVLIQFPTTTDLVRAGYKYRTSDNYVSTYWRQAQTTRISVQDYIEHYENFDILLAAENIDIEEIEIDEEGLIERARNIYGKMSLRDPNHEKSDPALWHDAYNFAYVQKMQKVDAKTPVDTKCLFLTTDQALTDFQHEDHELKNCSPVVIAPSQLLQIFSFSRPDSGYEETFIKFFASSSLGTSFEYDNDDIQEILSRIEHYKGCSPEVAERVLCRQLINSRYHTAETEAEKEELVYNSISEELLTELNLTKAKVEQLESENQELDDDNKAAIELLTENEERFNKELSRWQKEAADVKEERDAEAGARATAERMVSEKTEYSRAQESLYIDEQWMKWKRKHFWLFWGSLGAFLIILFITLYFWKQTGDTGHVGLLAMLAIPVVTFTFGCKVFSAGVETEIREVLLKDYHRRIDERKK